MAVLGLWALGAQGADTTQLVGTVMLSAGDRDPSHAVFETVDGRRLFIDVGQEIDGCRLVSVRPRQATMDCAEGLVSLTIRSDLQSRRAAPGVRSAAYVVTLHGETFALTAEDHGRIASQVSLEPDVREGWLHGYRVAWLEPGGDFYRLGIREDDVVISVNGTPASAPGAFMQAVSGLRGQAAFQLTVERDGRLIDYSYLFD